MVRDRAVCRYSGLIVSVLVSGSSGPGWSGTGESNAGGNPAMDWHSIQRQ